ncbi:MAG: DNA alkylation repair protein [Acidobacteria bacterium]|nr:DNA alkylation repair protein [Acidobacteriota bacterium]
MSTELSASQFIERLKKLRPDDGLRKRSARDESDLVGVTMGSIFKLAKEFIEMPLTEIEKMLESPFHKVRIGAVSIMDFQARSPKTSPDQKKKVFDLYIRRHDRIDTWDLVDRAAIYVVGGWLFDKSRSVLFKLAKSRRMAERRTAIVSTAYFIRKGDVADTFKLAEILIDDREELVNKATGWMLRYAGDKDRPQLLSFLDKYAAAMPRVMLRNSLEKLDKNLREHYMRMKD